MNLHRVIPGRILHIPNVVSQLDRLWLREGGVVDLDDPIVLNAVEGQKYKLAPAPELTADDVSPFPDSMIGYVARQRKLAEEGLAAVSPEAVEAEQRAATVGVGASTSGIQKPDAMPAPPPAGAAAAKGGPKR